MDTRTTIMRLSNLFLIIWLLELGNTAAFVIYSPRRLSAPLGASLVLVVPETDAPSRFGSSSPVENPSIHEAARHLGVKCGYFTNNELDVSIAVAKDLNKQHETCDVMIAMGIQDATEAQAAQQVFESRIKQGNAQLCQFGVDCALQLPSLVGPYAPTAPPLLRLLPWTTAATGMRMHEQMRDLLDRFTTDDFCYAVVLFVNQFVQPVDWVKVRERLPVLSFLVL